MSLRIQKRQHHHRPGMHDDLLGKPPAILIFKAVDFQPNFLA